jgi:outer membrane protein assembly factor BamB
MSHGEEFTLDRRFLLRGIAAAGAVSALTLALTATPGVAADATGVASAYQIDPKHDGYSAAGVAAPPLTEKWRRDLGGTVSYPVVSGHKAFVTAPAADGSYGTSLYAIDTRTGKDAWGPIPLGGTYFWSALTLGGGNVYALTYDGQLTAFAAGTGAQLWQTDLPGQYAFTSPPTFRAGMVYTGGAGSGGTVYAVNATTGAVVWTASVENGDDSSPAVTADGVYVTYACEQDYRFDPATGATTWHHSTGCEGGGGKTPVVAAGGLWVRESFDGPPVLNLNTGKVKTRFGSYGMPAPAFSGHTGFFVVGGVLHAADAATPDQAIWTFTGDGSPLTSAPIVVNGYVYVGSQSGEIYAVDPATGQAVWSANTGSAILGPDEQNVSAPLTGLSAGQGVLLVPASDSLVAYGA